MKVMQSLPKCWSGDETFWIYFALRTISEMFPAILISLFDAIVLAMTAKYGGDFGRQKMFGLFAVGTCHMLWYLVPIASNFTLI